MKTYHDHFTAYITCECGHEFQQPIYYIGYGQHCPLGNEDVDCPECGLSNAWQLEP